MNSSRFHCFVSVIALLFVQCGKHRSDINRNVPNHLIGTYFNAFDDKENYEYVELQFTPEKYMLYYHSYEGIGRPSVYKLTSDSTFRRWWIAGETEYSFYQRNDTLFLQKIDSTRQSQYTPYVKIDPEITLQNSFENDLLNEEFHEEAWVRVLRASEEKIIQNDQE